MCYIFLNSLLDVINDVFLEYSEFSILSLLFCYKYFDLFLVRLWLHILHYKTLMFIVIHLNTFLYFSQRFLFDFWVIFQKSVNKGKKSNLEGYIWLMSSNVILWKWWSSVCLTWWKSLIVSQQFVWALWIGLLVFSLRAWSSGACDVECTDPWALKIFPTHRIQNNPYLQMVHTRGCPGVCYWKLALTFCAFQTIFLFALPILCVCHFTVINQSLGQFICWVLKSYSKSPHLGVVLGSSVTSKKSCVTSRHLLMLDAFLALISTLFSLVI